MDSKMVIYDLSKLISKIDSLSNNQLLQIIDSLLSSLSVNIYIIQDNKYQFFNSEFERIIGYTKSELSSLNPFSLVHPDDRSKTHENLSQTINSSTPYQYEYRLITKSGKTVWIIETILSIQYKNKPALMGSFKDITALKTSEARYRTIIEDQTELICRHTPDEYIFTFVNNAFCHYFGKTKDEIIGRSILSLLSAEKIETLKENLASLSQETPVISFEYSDISPHGDIRWLRCTIRALFDDTGNIIEYQSVGHDITDLKRTEIKLRISQAELENKVKERTSELNKANKKLQGSYLNLQNKMGETIEALALTIEMRDYYTAGHQRRVANLASVIAKEMGLPEYQIKGIYFAASVHDIGKINIPSEILSKPSRLSEIEYALVKNHSQVGYDILKGVEFSWPIAKIVLQHQERINGSGYPFGITDKDILIEAKIIAVADVVDAMTTHRPYRPALGVDKALEEITKNKGILYDPAAVDACVKIIKNSDLKSKYIDPLFDFKTSGIDIVCSNTAYSSSTPTNLYEKNEK